MDGSEAGGGGYVGDPSEQLHRNEAISAVADEAFLGEEDDDYEDLYNDVNVGENFLQSFRRSEDTVGLKNDEPQGGRGILGPPPPQQPQPQQLPEQPVAGTGDATLVDESRVLGRVGGYQPDVGVGRGAGAPGGGDFRVNLANSAPKPPAFEDISLVNLPNNQQMLHQQPQGVNLGSYENVNMGNRAAGNVYSSENPSGGFVGGADGGGGVGSGGGGGTLLFVGDLHWWTTDAELESELCKYGPIKELKIYDERASGKSKGFCHVEFYDPAAASASKEGMHGHMFNGRPCVVAYASHYTIKKMGEAQVNRSQQQMGPSALNQPRRGPGDFSSKPGAVGGNVASGGTNQGNGDNNGRGFSRGNWNRGNPQGGIGNRGPMGPMRNRAGGMGGRGSGGMGNGFGQGMGVGPPMMHPQAMMGQGFDPSFGGPMGRMAGYGGFPGAPGVPFSGMLPSFGPVGNIGMGVAPHVNPAFFGRGMPMNGMGMMPNPGAEGPGMWPEPNAGGWAGDEQGGRAAESSYGEEAASDHHYAEGSQDRGPWSNNMKEKDRGPERDLSGSSERRHRDDRGTGYERDTNREKDTGRDRDWSEKKNFDEKDVGRDRDRERDRECERSADHERKRHRDERDRHPDYHRHSSRDAQHDDEGDRGRSSRTHTKSRPSHQDEHRHRPRDADYGRRR